MKFKETDTQPMPNGGIKLILDPITDEELPTVSIVTITHNRPEFISLMARNYRSIDYPREKLEWIVVDDSTIDIDYKPLEILGARVLLINKTRDPEKKLKIGHKRNFINCLTKHDYIVHMDDDDFYPAYSVISRIRVLLKHEKETNKPGCVGCNKVNCYDLVTDKTFEAFDSDSHSHSHSYSKMPSTVSESTLAYNKKFWSGAGSGSMFGSVSEAGHKFNNDDTITECLNFIGDYEVCVLPSSFVITQLTHSSNTVTRRPVDGTAIDGVIRNKQVFDYNFMDTIPAMDSNILNNIKTKIIMNMPEYSEAIEFVREILDYQRTKQKNYEHLINAKFEDLEYNAIGSGSEKRALKLLKNPLVLNIRYDSVQIKKKSSGKDVVYYCGPGDILAHESKWSPISKTLGGSEEAVINLSEYMVSKGYNVTVYNVLDGPSKKYSGVLFKNYWEWNPLDVQDLTIVWRDYTILKNVKKINSSKVYLDMHDAIEIKKNVRTRFDTIFVKSEFHKTFVKNGSKVAVVPNGIKPIPCITPLTTKENFAICTSSPDRCLHGLLKALPLIREKVPDFKVYWAYGFSAGVNEGGIINNTDPAVQKWYIDMLSLIKETDGFVDLGRLSQSELTEYYQKARYFIYGTHFTEIDCISLTKALSADCIPLVAGNGAIAEKIRDINKNFDLHTPFIETYENNGELIDTSLYEGPLFDKWVEMIIDIVKSNETNSNETKSIKEYIDNKYSNDSVYSQWL